jgi:hypothetical protein
MTPDQLIKTELARAKTKWPGWPDDIVHCASIMVEEAGESLKAALQYYYESGDIQEFIDETVQTGAMAHRILENILEGQVFSRHDKS